MIVDHLSAKIVSSEQKKPAIFDINELLFLQNIC